MREFFRAVDIYFGISFLKEGGVSRLSNVAYGGGKPANKTEPRKIQKERRAHMWYAFCKNSDGTTFRKEFSSPYFLRKFIIKCRYSKRIRVICHNCPND